MHDRRFRRRRRYFVAGLGISILPTTAFAIDHSWQNPADGSWSVAGNWNPASIPAAGDNIFLNQPAAYTITLNASPVGKDVTVSGGTVTFLPGTLITSGLAKIDGGGQVLVSGAGWRNESDDLMVGSASSGLINVSGGGSMTYGDLQVGVGTGSSGQVLVSGPGTVMGRINTTNGGTIGAAGAATLSVTNGARLNNSGVISGFQTSSTASATISGANTLWQIGMNNSSLTWGESGVATLQILGGAKVRISNVAGDGTTLTPVSQNQLIVGGQPVGTGVIVIDGANSQLYVGETSEVGDLGTGIATIQNGGLFQLSGKLSIGVHTFASGVVSVSGLGSQVQVAQNLYVGRDQGIATLNINNGGLVTSTNTDSRIGWFTSLARGNVFIDGVGSQWNSQDLYVGDAGQGSMTISNAGAANSTNVIVGAQGGGTGIATLGGAVSGTPATWNVSGSLTLGGTVGSDGGAGTLVLNTDGFVNVGTIKLWDSGTLILNGGTINAGSIQLNSASSKVNFQSGTFRYTGNRTLNALALTNVLGATPTLLAGRHLAVANTGSLTASLTLNGGIFSVGTINNIASLNFLAGTFNLTAQNLTIGAGGLFGNSPVLATGKAINVTNTATITGGSTLTLSGGAFGAGTFVNSGTAALTGGSLILGNATNSATINNSGGYVGWTVGANSATIITSGGTINSGTANNTGFMSITTGATLLTGGGLRNAGSVSVNGSTISGPVNNVSSLTVSSGTVITGSGLINGGSMTLTASTLSGPVTNNASMSISNGTVITGAGLSNNGSMSLGASSVSGPVTNNNSISITGDVIFGGPVTGGGSFVGGGTAHFSSGLSPGSSPATVSFAGNVAFETGNMLNIELGGHTPGTQHDRLSIAGDLKAGAGLAVTLINGLSPVPGESFDVISFGSHSSGDFNIINDPARPGLTFTTEFTPSLMRLITGATFAGDANLDARVNISDLLILANHWQQLGGGTWTTADFNNDGNIDNIDLGILAANWQAGVGAPGPGVGAALSGLGLSVPTIPEPAGLSSVAIGLMMGSLNRRRRRIHVQSG